MPAEIADGSRDDLAGRRLARTIRCAISVDTLAGASRRTRLQAAMLDGAEDGLMLLSAVRGGDGTVHDFMCRAANPAAGRLLAGPLAGSSLRRQIPGLAWLFDELVHLLAYDCPIALDHPVAGAERPAWLRISANPADRDHVALAISDVTHHHLLAQALRGLREERQTNEQNRLALLTDASHGLRTPLNSIIGFAEIINAEMLGRLNVPRYREYVRDILVAGRHLLEVVDSFADRERLQLTAARDDEGHRALIELAPDMVCMIRGGRVTMMNTAGAEMLGCPGSGMIGQAFAGVIHSDYVGIAEDDFAVLAAERTRVPMKFVRHDGRLIEVEVAASRLRDGDGPSVMLLARDVTERNRATRSVVAREERLRKIMDTVADGLVIVDEHGIIDSVNPAAERIFDHDARTLVGQAVDEVLAEPFAVLRARLAGRRAGAAADYETMARRRDGGLVPVEISVSELTLADRRLFIGVMRDVTRRRQIEAHLRYLANHEPLTGLPNRALLQERLQAAVQRADLADRPVAVLFIDLDNFKNINDTMGHPFGDRLLQAVARRLEGCIGGEDTIGHPAGDEFIVVLPSISGAAAAESTAQEILRALAQPFALDDKDIYITASIGVALYPGDGRDLPSLMKNVDMATFHAKSMGRNNVQFFTQELSTRAQARVAIENGLRFALARRELELYYQPKVDLMTGRVVGAEALLRWHGPELGPVSPIAFIPVAEETGLIIPIGRWVLQTACRQVQAWRRQGLPELGIAVNLSARQFKHPELAQEITDALRDTGINPALVELELTESMLVDNAQEAVEIMRALKTLGVRLAIDDFGTGYSSLGYLKRFPLDALKIDRSFVKDIPGDADDVAITRAIIHMAHSLGLELVAEGIESPDQADFLREQGCQMGQGYHFGRPLDATAFAHLLECRGG